MIKRERWASVLTVSVKSWLLGLSKSNKIGKYPRVRSSSFSASKTALRSGVKRPRMSTAFFAMVSMTSRIFGLLSNK